MSKNTFKALKSVVDSYLQMYDKEGSLIVAEPAKKTNPNGGEIEEATDRLPLASKTRKFLTQSIVKGLFKKNILTTDVFNQHRAKAMRILGGSPNDSKARTILMLRKAPDETLEKVEKMIGEAITEAASMGSILRKISDAEGPFTVIAVEKGKVVNQEHAKFAKVVPAFVRTMGKEYPRAKIAVENKSGKIVFHEDVIDDVIDDVIIEATMRLPTLTGNDKEFDQLLIRVMTFMINGNTKEGMKLLDDVVSFMKERGKKLTPKQTKAVKMLKQKFGR